MTMEGTKGAFVLSMATLLLGAGLLSAMTGQAAAVPTRLRDYDPSGLVRFATPQEADAKRRELVRFIWRDGLPVKALPKVTTGIDKGVFENDLTGVNGSLARSVDRLDAEVAPFGFHAISYLIHPRAAGANNRHLLIVHSGHRRGVALGEGVNDTIDRLLADGFTVLVMDMPLYGWNKDATAELPDGAGTLTFNDNKKVLPHPHDDIFNKVTPKLPDGTVFRFFLEPVVQGINYFLHANPDAVDVSMLGLSGGGWTTHLAAAVDPRIKQSFPVAGSMPLYARAIVPASEGDAEQIYAPLYREVDSDGDGITDTADGVASYLEIYVLGGYGKGRRQIQILNFEDSCCFSTDAYETYDDFVSGVVDKLGAGDWDLHSDRTHKSHIISADVLKNVIMPALATARPDEMSEAAGQ